jgi:hypothetical protein
VHYHGERNHQGKDNRILFPSRPEARGNTGAVRCRERLGGLLISEPIRPISTT